MIQPDAAPSAAIIARYLRAKDAQVPHLYRQVFVPDSLFTTTFTGPSPFGERPPQRGLAAITDTFRQLGQRCENIVTVVPTESISEQDGILTSRWVVAMTIREQPAGFTGWGTYRWVLDAGGLRARELHVTFEGMAPLDGESAPVVLDRMLSLSHPWCSTADLRSATDDLPLLAELRAWVGA